MKLSSIVLLICLLSSAQGAAGSQTYESILDDERNLRGRLVGQIDHPTRETETSIEFDLHDIVLNPHERIYLKVPIRLSPVAIDWVAVTHRQEPSEELECGSFHQKERDCKPAYLSLELYNQSQVPGEVGWRAWGGVGSGPLNSKFAEVRHASSPETDNLYEWQKKGHISVETKQWSKNPLLPVAIRARNLGSDSLHLHKIILRFLPPRPDEILDFIFSDGLRFGDFLTAEGRRHPGRTDSGDYGNSLNMNRFSYPRHSVIPNEWRIERGALVIPLQIGKKLVAIDVAGGDMKQVPRGQNPEDYRGGARLRIDYIKNGQVSEVLMASENVGSNGVMRASPERLQTPVRPGDCLRVTVPKGEMHIMGIRLSYLR